MPTEHEPLAALESWRCGQPSERERSDLGSTPKARPHTRMGQAGAGRVGEEQRVPVELPLPPVSSTLVVSWAAPTDRMELLETATTTASSFHLPPGQEAHLPGHPFPTVVGSLVEGLVLREIFP